MPRAHFSNHGRSSLMRFVHFFLACTAALTLTFVSGCGGDASGPAAPAADLNEIDRYLQENPDQNTDEAIEEMEEEEL